MNVIVLVHPTVFFNLKVKLKARLKEKDCSLMRISSSLAQWKKDKGAEARSTMQRH
jgi:hypothetical protein